MVSAYGDMRNIREAMNNGAFDFATKPIDMDDLDRTIEKAVNQIHFVRESQREHKQLESLMTELTLANEIQQYFLPREFPPFPEDSDKLDLYASMEAAKDVGGDFYDFFRIDDDRIAVVIADVCGKGIPAAMMMGVSRMIIRTKGSQGVSAAECIAASNQMLAAYSVDDMFVTVFYAIYNTKTGLLNYCNAGHLPPHILRPNGTIDASLFSICTLNVDGLPAYDFVNNDGPDTKYTPVISRYLADHNFDFIGVQENFDFDKELGRCLTANYDHDSWAGGMSANNLFNDGVHPFVFHTDGCKAWWQSHLKTVRTDSVRWNNRYGYDDHCRDEAATKGFRRYEVTTTDGFQLVVYNMHMEASERWDEVGGTDSLDRDCRSKQWIQLKQHIMSKLDERPVIVIGDFNTYYCRDNMKSVFIDAINASGRATCGDAWIEKCKGGVYPELEKDTKIADDGDYLGWTIRGEMPDKILYINPTGGHSVELLSCEYDNCKQTRAYYKDGGDEPLGDHFPLFAKFRLKN